MQIVSELVSEKIFRFQNANDIVLYLLLLGDCKNKVCHRNFIKKDLLAKKLKAFNILQIGFQLNQREKMF